MDETAPRSHQRPPLDCPLPIPPIELRCPDCSYDLTGLTEPRCPECGNAFDLNELFHHALGAKVPVREAVLRHTFGDLADELAGPIRNLAATIDVTLTSAVGIIVQQHFDETLGREATPEDFRGLYDRLEAGRDLFIPLPRPPRALGENFDFPDTDLRCRECDAPLIGVRRGRCPGCARPIDPAALLPRDVLVSVTRRYRERQPLAVLLARTALETDGIPNATTAGNAALRTIGGISLATLSVPRSYFFDALAFLDSRRADDDAAAVHAEAWRCPACGESNPASFELCWNCGRAHD